MSEKVIIGIIGTGRKVVVVKEMIEKMMLQLDDIDVQMLVSNDIHYPLIMINKALDICHTHHVDIPIICFISDANGMSATRDEIDANMLESLHKPMLFENFRFEESESPLSTQYLPPFYSKEYRSIFYALLVVVLKYYFIIAIIQKSVETSSFVTISEEEEDAEVP